MLTKKSDFGHLDGLPDHICKPAQSRKVTIRKWFETITILTCLIGGGVGLGYIYGAQKADQIHAAEIDRLQKAYDTNVDYLSYRLARAAAAVEGAATAVEGAANTADAAANTAESAAIDAKRAVNQATARKAKPAPAPFAVPVYVTPSAPTAITATVKPMPQPANSGQAPFSSR